MPRPLPDDKRDDRALLSAIKELTDAIREGGMGGGGGAGTGTTAIGGKKPARGGAAGGLLAGLGVRGVAGVGMVATMGRAAARAGGSTLSGGDFFGSLQRQLFSGIASLPGMGHTKLGQGMNAMDAAQARTAAVTTDIARYGGDPDAARNIIGRRELAMAQREEAERAKVAGFFDRQDVVDKAKEGSFVEDFDKAIAPLADAIWGLVDSISNAEIFG